MAKRTTKQIKITLLRSSAGCSEDQRRTLASLGLRHRHQTVIKADTPAIRGMVAKVAHLVEVGEPE